MWDGTEEEQKLLDWYNDKPWTTLFCDGNHENFDLLSKYPVEEWNGGKVQYAVDYIITHSAPSIALPSINLTYKPDVLTKYLTVIQQITEYTHWYCGHYHTNKKLPYNCTTIYNAWCRLPKEN